MTIWLLLGALRNFPIGMSALRAGEWRGKKLPSLGHDPQGKVLGILGMGGIGRNVAAKARAFGMKIRYYNRNKLSPELEEGAEYVSFETLLKESDVLSLNLPLNVRLSSCLSLYLRYAFAVKVTIWKANMISSLKPAIPSQLLSSPS